MNDERASGSSAASAKTSSFNKRRRADGSDREAEPQIGRALRSVYDDTVGETIPKEMLDLLGRLG